MANIDDRIIAVSGAFEPLHFGHVKLFEAARLFGKVVVILNSDDWVYQQKGYLLQNFSHRKNMLLALENVHDVVSVDDSDGTVVEALKRIKPHAFGNGGSRGAKTTPERQFCLDNDIKLVYGLGGNERAQISMDIKEIILNASKTSQERNDSVRTRRN